MNTIKRKKTRQILVGKVPVGGNAPVVVQSMTKTDTSDVKATVRQIRRLQQAGCEIVRVAVPDEHAVEALREIVTRVQIPVIADIHFDWRLAIGAVKAGVHGLRLNPGNIGASWKVREVVKIAKERTIPIRVGVNSGSLPKDILKKYGHPTAEALVEAAVRQIEILEEMDFHTIKVSLKGTSVPLTVEAYRVFSERFDYPLHVGITESGPPPEGLIRSSIGIGILLAEGIGDTIRVSLTAPPWVEVDAAYCILSCLGIRQRGVDIYSCPTCGRCRVNIDGLVKKVKKGLKTIDRSYKVAVMGCMVNGPGEAREADFGVAGGKGEALIFKHGQVLKKVPEKDVVQTLLSLIQEEE